jgi:hypothetical protein
LFLLLLFVDQINSRNKHKQRSSHQSQPVSQSCLKLIGRR